MAKNKTILVECENLRLTKGTGIATYAVNLAKEIRELKHSPRALIGVEAPIDTKNDFLNEVRLFDARSANKDRSGKLLRSAFQRVFADPFGSEAKQINLSGYVYQGASPLKDGAFDALYGVQDLDIRSRRHFKRYGNFLTIRGVDSASAFHATQPIATKVPNIPNLYTIHDLIPLRLPYATLNNKKEFYKLIRKITQNADKLVTVSEFSKKDIISTFGVPEDRIVNTYQSVFIPPRLMNLPDDEVAGRLERSFGLEFRNYFLFAGAIEPKKNVKRMVAGYAASGSKRPLVIAGGLGWQYDEDLAAINNERFQHYRIEDRIVRTEKMVRRLDYVSRPDLVLLLKGARALVFPSLYEGFGLPVLEAMLVGTPVITSNTSSLPEVAADAAEYVEPFDVNSIASAIRRLDHDDDLWTELKTKGTSRVATFSPENYQRRLKTLYDSLL